MGKINAVTRILAMLLTLIFVLALASCKFEDVNGNETSGNGTTNPGGTQKEPATAMDFMTTDLTPYIALGQYKGIELTAKEMEYLVTLREMIHADGAYFEKSRDPERVVKEGDIINVDYTGYRNGVEFDGGKATKQDITVFENGKYIDGFASGYIGAKVGEPSEFEVTFPDDYGEESLAGRKVTFKFTVNYICEFDELTEEIVTDLSDGRYKTVEEFEAFYRGQTAQVELWKKVIEHATVRSYPEQQVNYYYQQSRTYYEYYASLYGMSYEELLSKSGISDAELKESAKTYTLEDLVYYAILKAENIQLTEEEYNAELPGYIKMYKDRYGYDEKYIRENLLASIEDNMLYDKLQRTLIGWAKISWE